MQQTEANISIDLNKLYSFNQDNLKQRFLDLSNSVFLNHNVYMKEYNLLLFRLIYPQLPFPEIPFSYSTDSSFNYDISTSITETLQTYLDDKSADEPVKYSISKILKDNFQFNKPSINTQIPEKIQLFSPEQFAVVQPNQNESELPFVSPETSLSFISDYFCHLTFPALFAHFSSEEYLRAGFNYIKSRIKDSLAPQLVGVYLLHYSLFKDRLLSTFIDNLLFMYDNLASKKSKNIYDKIRSPDSLLDNLYNAFAQCMSYFTEYHFNIVNLLRKENEDSAIIAVCDYFLREVVSLFKYSPLLTETGLLTKTRCLKNPQSYSQFIQTNYLDILYENIGANSEFSLKILNLFKDMDYVYTEMPKISTIKYQDGFSFCISLADMKIIRCLYLADRHSKGRSLTDKFKPITNIKEFLTETLLMKPKFVQYINAGVNEPERKEVSAEMTENRLLEQKSFHVFLNQRAEGMKFLKDCANSALNNLKLKEKQYVSNLWKNNNRIGFSINDHNDFIPNVSKSSNPFEFEKDLLASFCYSILTGYLNYGNTSFNIDLMSFYHKIKNHLSEEKEKKTLRDLTINTISFFLKLLDNGKVISDDICSSASFVCDAIERLSFELLLKAMNDTPKPFLKSTLPVTPSGEEITGVSIEELRDREFSQYLSHNTSSFEPLPQDEEIIKDGIELIPESQFEIVAQPLVNASTNLKAILLLTNAAMSSEISLMAEKFRFGNKLSFFLAIHDLIEKSVERSDFLQYGPYYLNYYYKIVINDKFDYLKVSLISCIDLFSEFLSKNRDLFPKIADNVLKSFEYMKTAFNITDTITKSLCSNLEQDDI